MGEPLAVIAEVVIGEVVIGEVVIGEVVIGEVVIGEVVIAEVAQPSSPAVVRRPQWYGALVLVLCPA